MVLLGNFILVPEIIEFFVLGETIETKSELHKTIMIRIFIFLTFAYVLLPLTGYYTVFSYLS